ncbi:MAG: archease [Promethearchaeati archaeon SRVP18_Atabeyarchaeia-1]
MGYRYLEHTADVMIEARGASIGEAFSFGAEAMFNVMLDPSKVDQKMSVKIEVSAEDIEALLYSWLEELLFRFSVDRIAFSAFRFHLVKVGGGLKGMGEARGETYDPKKHGRKTEVKAITYAEMQITEDRDGSRIRFVLDI